MGVSYAKLLWAKPARARRSWDQLRRTNPRVCRSGRIQGSAPGISSRLLTPCLQGRRSSPHSVPPVWPRSHRRLSIRAKAAAAFPGSNRQFLPAACARGSRSRSGCERRARDALRARPGSGEQSSAPATGPGSGRCRCVPAGRATGSCRPAPPRPAPRAPGAVTGSGEKQRQEQRRPHAGCRWLRAPGLKLACCAELRLGAAEPGPPRRGARGERRPRSSPARPGPARSSPAQPAPAQRRSGAAVGLVRSGPGGAGHPAAAVPRATGQCTDASKGAFWKGLRNAFA